MNGTMEVMNGGRTLVFPVKAGQKITEGMIVAIKEGYAIAGAKTTGAITVGVAVEPADNTNGADGGIEITVKRGAFKILNSSVNPVTQADVFKTAYFVDAYTVTAIGTGSSAVGKILSLDGEDVIVEIM